MRRPLIVLAPPWSATMPHLGAASLLAWLDGEGLEADFVDLNEIVYQNLDQATAARAFANFAGQAWTSLDPALVAPGVLARCAAALDGFAPEIVGVSALATSLPWLDRFWPVLHQRFPEAIFALGGPAASFPETRAAVGAGRVHWFIEGEGERPLAALVRTPTRRVAAGVYQGLRVWEEGNAHDAMVVRDDEPPGFEILPAPRFDDFDPVGRGYHTFPAMLSRGCIRRCTFCNDIDLWRGFRTDDPQRLFARIAGVVERFAARAVDFADLLLNGRLEPLAAFADAVHEAGISVVWGGNAVFRKDLDPSWFERLRRGGCSTLVFGLESGSPSVLKAMRKGFTLDLARRTLAHCHAAGIATHVNVVVGYPGEDDGDFARTLAFLEDERGHLDRVANLNPCYLSPGAEARSQALARGIIGPDHDGAEWSDGAGSTPFERAERLRRVEACCARIALPVGPETLAPRRTGVAAPDHPHTIS